MVTKKADDNELMAPIEAFVTDGESYSPERSRVTRKFARDHGWEHLFQSIAATHGVEDATAAPGAKRDA